MNTETEIKEVTFDLVSALILIGSDDSLLTMYKGKFGVDIKLAITNAKEGVKSESDAFVKGMFENIIMKRKEYLNSYVRVFRGENPTQNVLKEESPRRYGKEKILADVTASGGKPTEVQRMLLEVNDLKNLVAKLNRLGKAQHEGRKDTLTDAQCREIIGTVQTVKAKMKKILK